MSRDISIKNLFLIMLNPILPWPLPCTLYWNVYNNKLLLLLLLVVILVVYCISLRNLLKDSMLKPDGLEAIECFLWFLGGGVDWDNTVTTRSQCCLRLFFHAPTCGDPRRTTVTLLENPLQWTDWDLGSYKASQFAFICTAHS